MFLDEVGELPPAAQAKLLRALEERTITPVGATAPRKVDVRLVAATHRPLDDMVRDGGFREDLMYRLKVITLVMPPLRDRREDIMPLVAHFISQLAERHGRPALQLSDAARSAILSYSWPGNVRELRNVLERALVLADGKRIEVGDLPPHVAENAAVLRPAEAVIADVPFSEARERAADAFDRAYIAHEVDYHKAVIAAVDQLLIPTAANAELKQTLISVRPALVAHLEHAEHLLGGLK